MNFKEILSFMRASLVENYRRVTTFITGQLPSNRYKITHDTGRPLF